MTPHNEAAAGDYAPTVLLSGDPLRSEWIAETFLEDARCVNRIRGALGYTGSYQGMPVSVQTTGIGIPSLSIYVHELLETYGARVLFRVGTCGGLQDHVRIRDLVISQAAATDSGAEGESFGAYRFAPAPDLGLLSAAAEEARKSGVRHHIGSTASSDVFYHSAGDERYRPLRAHGLLAVDMETSGLYTLASRFGARALSICMGVDNVFTGESIAEAERQAVFRPMIELALATACGVS
ncbi:purine-nucleoside phosphorylase [Aquibium oceanicum]|uniref:Purine nucleoside phosphorylase DeoD-type n=1 Tax=Aquibium oceanicum TaxID=1670800 RepID=A0A1L3SRV4_9HYPH|nr:purine-nucleoside phosphorylase [Aquibium oceanicum]APH72138.1 purine-nucleoside phosphorylase [Aquibium oceanicum]